MGQERHACRVQRAQTLLVLESTRLVIFAVAKSQQLPTGFSFLWDSVMHTETACILPAHLRGQLIGLDQMLS